MDIRITTDSTCDLGELIDRYGIGVQPLSVILGNNAFRDGVNIAPQDIFSFVEKTGILPKTSAPSIGDYEEFFSRYIDAGETVVHYDISAKASSSYEHALEAAKRFGGRVRVVDTRALSSGQGLMVMKAVDYSAEGMGAKEIAERTAALAPKINTSFVPDRLDYLYKGGRCSRMQMYGANLLKIHPLIEMREGQLYAGKKYRGSMEKCITSYLKDLKEQYPVYDKRRAFITHSSAEPGMVDTARQLVKELFDFEEVIETVAGSVITGHCGKNTLGVLFIAE